MTSEEADVAAMVVVNTRGKYYCDKLSIDHQTSAWTEWVKVIKKLSII